MAHGIRLKHSDGYMVYAPYAMTLDSLFIAALLDGNKGRRTCVIAACKVVI